MATFCILVARPVAWPRRNCRNGGRGETVSDVIKVLLHSARGTGDVPQRNFKIKASHVWPQNSLQWSYLLLAFDPMASFSCQVCSCVSCTVHNRVNLTEAIVSKMSKL